MAVANAIAKEANRHHASANREVAIAALRDAISREEDKVEKLEFKLLGIEEEEDPTLFGKLTSMLVHHQRRVGTLEEELAGLIQDRDFKTMADDTTN